MTMRRVANTPPSGYDTRLFCHILLIITPKTWCITLLMCGTKPISNRDIARNGVYRQEERALLKTLLNLKFMHEKMNYKSCSEE